jgi:hypothetical protein
MWRAFLKRHDHTVHSDFARASKRYRSQGAKVAAWRLVCIQHRGTSIVIADRASERVRACVVVPEFWTWFLVVEVHFQATHK